MQVVLARLELARSAAVHYSRWTGAASRPWHHGRHAQPRDAWFGIRQDHSLPGLTCLLEPVGHRLVPLNLDPSCTREAWSDRHPESGSGWVTRLHTGRSPAWTLPMPPVPPTAWDHAASEPSSGLVYTCLAPATVPRCTAFHCPPVGIQWDEGIATASRSPAHNSDMTWLPRKDLDMAGRPPQGIRSHTEQMRR